jgi:hypothetical protein
VKPKENAAQINKTTKEKFHDIKLPKYEKDGSVASMTARETLQ